MSESAHDQLVDKAIDAYVSWREESAAASDAYQGWTNAPSPQAALAFAAYLCALDREEQAARVYAACVTKVTVAAPRPSLVPPQPTGLYVPRAVHVANPESNRAPSLKRGGRLGSRAVAWIELVLAGTVSVLRGT